MQKKTGLVPKKPEAAAQSTLKTEAESKGAGTDVRQSQMRMQIAFLAADVLQQLQTVFSRMESPLMLELHLNEQPVSAELKKLYGRAGKDRRTSFLYRFLRIMKQHLKC